jgi:hypothetical protein
MVRVDHFGRATAPSQHHLPRHAQNMSEPIRIIMRGGPARRRGRHPRRLFFAH